MPLINVRKAIRNTVTTFRSEFRSLIRISWLYIFLSCLFTISIPGIYFLSDENHHVDYYTEHYHLFIYLICPIAKALLAAISIINIYRHLILGPQSTFTTIVIRRDIITDDPTIALPVYFPATRAILIVAISIIFWGYSLSYLTYDLWFHAFTQIKTVAFRILIRDIILISYSFLLAQFSLVFPYISVSKPISMRAVFDNLRKLKGNRVRTWAVLFYFSMFYSAIRGLLRGRAAERIPFEFYHSDVFIVLRYVMTTLTWFAYVTTMVIFSARAFHHLSAPAEAKKEDV